MFISKKETNMNTKCKLFYLLVALVLVLSACKGETGPQGPVGPQGSQGETGPQGPVGPVGPALDLAPTQPVVPIVALVNPSLHHADSQPPENGVGSFDVGVKQGQIGIAFGIHIAWPKGGLDAGGGGCNLVILTPGWYENLQVHDGRYEVYDVPLSDYLGWVKVLGQQRADEQAKDYGCPAKSFQDLPQWESPIPSPP